MTKKIPPQMNAELLQGEWKRATGVELAGAALDVFQKEPPSHSALLSLLNVLVTQHIGSTREAGVRTALLAVENAMQALAGERCPHAVNPAVYEHWRTRA
jgi:glyoxylate reductase